MAHKLKDLLQAIQNSTIRISLERMMALAGVSMDSGLGTALVSDVTGDVAGDLTGDVLADDETSIIVSGSTQPNSSMDIGSIVSAATVAGVLSADTNTPVNAVAAEALLTSSGALAAAVHAVSVLTSTGTNVDAEDTVTINTTVYTFKADPTGVAFGVDVGTDLTTSLANLLAAINLSGTPDTEYGAGTTAHPTAFATASDATTLTLQVLIPGDESNAEVTETDADDWSWTGADFANGTVAGVTSAASLVTIGTRIYTVVDELSETTLGAPNAIVDQVLKGANEAATLANIKKALNAGDTEGTEYSTGTVANVQVSGDAVDATTLVVTALVAGVAAHTIACVTTLANTAFDAAVLGTETAGVDGTVGVLGEIAWDASYLYVCTVVNTIADANWERAGISSY